MRNILIYLSKKVIAIIMLIIIAIFIVIKIAIPETIETASQSISSKYHILVDVEESKMYVIENGNCIKTYTCAGGKVSTPSPIGTWTIVSKGKWGEGFGGSWLRF